MLPDEPDLPTMPLVVRGVQGDHATSLPPLPADAGSVPTMPGMTGESGQQAGGDLPAAPALDLPALPSAPAAAPLAKLKGDAKAFAKRLQASQPLELRGAFPDYKNKVLALSPKAKKFAAALGAALAALPATLVHIEVTVGLTGVAAADTQARAEVEQQATLLREALATGFGVGAERVTTHTQAMPGAKKNDKKLNAIVVTVGR